LLISLNSKCLIKINFKNYKNKLIKLNRIDKNNKLKIQLKLTSKLKKVQINRNSMISYHYQ